jgi:integrase
MALKFSKLTRLEMRKLAPGRALREHGITFERLSNGDGRFSVNIMVDGVRVHRVLGMESSGVTRKQAENFIERARTDARQGRLNLPKGRKLTLTFSEAAQRYTDRLAETGGKDLGMKRYRLRAHLCPFFTDKPLSRVTTFDVERYKKKRIEASAAPGSVNRELATLSHLFTKAVEWKWLDHRPASIKRLSEDRGRITYLTIEQIERLLATARADQSFEVYPFIVIGLETGMRRMEILSIRRENIDLGRRVIFVPKAKAGAREQLITAHLAHYLASLMAMAQPGQEWLFPAHSGNGHFIGIEKPFRRVVAAAGLDPKKVVRHTLRHTAITHLVQAGVDIPTVQRISGHKTVQMVLRYSHANGRHIQTAMDRLDARYRGSCDTITQELHQKSTEAEEKPTQVSDFNGGPCRNRTYDQRIKSPLLYRLS